MHDLSEWGNPTHLKYRYENAIFSIPCSCFKMVVAIDEVELKYDDNIVLKFIPESVYIRL